MGIDTPGGAEEERLAGFGRVVGELMNGSVWAYEKYVESFGKPIGKDLLRAQALAMNGYLNAQEHPEKFSPLDFEKVFPFLKEGPSAPEFRAAAEERARRCISVGWMHLAKADLERGWITPEFFQTKEAEDAAGVFLKKLVANPVADNDIEIFLSLPFSEPFLHSDNVNAMLSNVTPMFVRYKPEVALRLMERLRGTGFEPPADTVAEKAMAGIHNAFEVADLAKVEVYRDRFGLADELPTPLERRGVAEHFVYKLNRDLDGLLAFCDRFGTEGVFSKEGKPPYHLAEVLSPIVSRGDWDRFDDVLRRIGAPDGIVQAHPFGLGSDIVEQMSERGEFQPIREFADRYDLDTRLVRAGVGNGVVQALRTLARPEPKNHEEALATVDRLLAAVDSTMEKAAPFFPEIKDITFKEGYSLLDRMLDKNPADAESLRALVMILDALHERTQERHWLERKEREVHGSLLNADGDEFPKFAAAIGIEPAGYDALKRKVLAWALGESTHPSFLKRVESFMKTHGLDASVFQDPVVLAAGDDEMRFSISKGRIERARAIDAFTKTGRFDRILADVRETKGWDRKRIVDKLRHDLGDFEEGVRLLGITADDFAGVAIPPSVATRELPEALRALGERDVWAESFKRLLKIQGRSARIEHDPWFTDFDVLIGKLVESGAVDRSAKEDGEIVLEFVKQFGMVNTPLIAEIFIALKRGKTFAELGDDQKRRLVETIGGRVERMTNDQLINELKLTRQRLVTDLLADKIPGRLTTEIGIEMLNATVGVTQWHRKEDNPAEHVALLKKTMADAKKREAIVPPDAYFDSRDPRYAGMELSVRRAYHRPAPRDMREKVQGEIRDLLAERPESPTSVGRFVKRLEQAWKAADAGEYTGSKMVLDVLAGKSAVNGLPDMPNTATKEERGHWFASQMEGLAREPGEISADDWLVFSMAHLDTMVDNSWVRQLRQIARDPSLNPDRIERLAEVMQFFVFEHYLAENQATHGTGDAPFSAELVDKLRRAWEFESERQDKHPVMVAMTEIEALQGQLETVVFGEPSTVALVPTGGVMRVFSGDVGDACYNSKHDELAGGKYPGVRSLMFVTHRGDGKERVIGSVLFVEARTKDGKRALVVRANNPRQNLLGAVSAEDLVEQTIQAAVRVAERGGFDLVALPTDFAGQSSSNRPEVSRIYRQRFRVNRRVELENTADTNFNGYAIWDPKGPHAVAVVWEKT